MIDLADARTDRFEVDILDPGLAGDLVRRRLRDDAKLGLSQRQGTQLFAAGFRRNNKCLTSP